MVLRELRVNGPGLDKVLVHHEVADAQFGEILVGAAEEHVGEEAKGEADQHWHVEEGHDGDKQPDEYRQSTDFAVWRGGRVD